MSQLINAKQLHNLIKYTGRTQWEELLTHRESSVGGPSQGIPEQAVRPLLLLACSTNLLFLALAHRRGNTIEQYITLTQSCCQQIPPVELRRIFKNLI